MLKIIPLYLTIFFLSALTTLSAQVEKKVVVEHFTNTKCSVCANRNPDFFANLDNHPDVLHIAIHPSAPYSDCFLNNNNPEENDARTNYYGIYGSTPKLVIQGENIAVNADYGDAEIFAPYLGETSPLSIDIFQLDDFETGLSGDITIRVEAENDLGELDLFVALVEDTVFYDAPNGEDMHFNVFRKRLIADFETFSFPNNSVGESLYFPMGALDIEEWDKDRLTIIAILQRTDTKEVIQAAQTVGFVMAGTNDLPKLQNVNISPNPVQTQLNITLESNTETEVRLIDITGRILSSASFQNETQINTSELAKGIYFIELKNEEGRLTQKVVKN
ncbi:MAG: hypothetical protein ACI85O_000880 [Saprospiraceae bacterium]|jgi:hypothetical protein